MAEKKVVCPSDHDTWKKAEKAFGCNSSDVYHCILNEKKIQTEVCTLPSWVEPNYCPVYYRNASKLDVVKCLNTTGKCSSEVYWSTEVYKYSACFTAQLQPEEDNQESSNFPIIVPILVLAIVFAAAFIALAIWRHRRSSTNTRSGNGVELSKLLSDYERTADGGRYQETKAYSSGLNILSENRLLIITGIQGSGKTCLGSQILSTMQNNHNLKAQVFQNFQDINLDTVLIYTNTVLLMDDCLRSLGNQYISGLVEFLKRIHKNRRQMYVIVILDQNLFKELKVISELFDMGLLIDLSTEEFKLTENEKRGIFKKHRPATISDSDFKNIVLSSSEELGFPETCAVFCSMAGVLRKNLFKAFFKTPVTSLQQHFTTMELQEKKDYGTLVYIMFCGGSINDIDMDINEGIIDQISTDLKCRKELMTKQNLSTLGSYLEVQDEGARCKYRHRSVLEAVFKQYGEKYTAGLITLCSDEMLYSLVRTTGNMQGVTPFTVIVSDRHFEILAARINTLNDGKSTANHPAMKDRIFGEFYKRWLNQKSEDQRKAVDQKRSEDQKRSMEINKSLKQKMSEDQKQTDDKQKFEVQRKSEDQKMSEKNKKYEDQKPEDKKSEVQKRSEGNKKIED